MSRFPRLPAFAWVYACLLLPLILSAETHIVRPGDTLWGISNHYGVSQEAIRTANRLPTDSVVIGQSLVIPGRTAPAAAKPKPKSKPSTQPAARASSNGYHVVAPGETFSGIASRNGVSMSALQAANPGVSPDPLLVGTRLAIPGKGTTAAKPPPVRQYSSALDYPPGPSSTPKKPSPGSTASHTVRPGDTLTGIAAQYGVNTSDIESANRIPNPDVLPVGLRLTIPGAAVVSAPGPAPASYRPNPVAPPPPAAAAPETPKVAAAAEPSAAPNPIQAPASSKPKSDSFADSHRAVLAYRLEKGDNLDTVANLFGTTPDRLRTLNKLPPGASLKAGDELVVPAMASVGN